MPESPDSGAPYTSMRRMLRLAKLYRLLAFTFSRPVSINVLAERLEASTVTVKRDLSALRKELGLTIIYDVRKKGYVLRDRDKYKKSELRRTSKNKLFIGMFVEDV